ncbi:asparagine synthase C-terminal domain-containing protein [Sphingobium boeckii]|uniref:asparagine synthase (glutamine-hydrolyzing) n=1 Tax=Sphingobium boeckii TaxID=1082345 RepID=A0A7W9AG24_9SPHN|nr:asparagine synthase C-terminal domain-containing protein [Sphingobium boeckii]MBB5685015.1 asparagine synthase (glutamine-hydrolyzing) [Sphingobium boeckii]
MSPVENPDADAQAAALFDRLIRADSRRQTVFELPGLRLCVRSHIADWPIHRMEGGHSIVIGDVFERNLRYRAPPELGPFGQNDGQHICRTLSARFWGRYLAMGVDAARGPWLMRDPSGAFPVYLWTLGPVVIVSNTLASDLLAIAGGPPVIDWARMAILVADPVQMGIISPLRHVTMPVPGVLKHWTGKADEIGDGFKDEPVWSPTEAASRCETEPAKLAEIVESCLTLWGKGHQRVSLDLSGGLDSAIVLGALSKRPDGPIVHCLNINFSSAGDERPYARAAAARWSAPVTEALVEPEDLDYLQALTGPRHPRPLLYGMDVLMDRLSCEAATAAGASLALTGQGGDAMFMQPATVFIAADYLKCRGFDRHFLELVAVAARRLNRSVWSILRDIARPPAKTAHGDADLASIAGPALQPVLGTSFDHPWQVEARGLAPGKRFQIDMLVNCQIFHAPTRTAQHFRLCHPLLSQPIVEACLSLPLWVLSPDIRDRGLARDLFAPLLPDVIRLRRSKGNTTNFYNRTITAHLGTLRPFLLDGQLVAHGLIDRDTLDALLDPHCLLLRNVHGLIARLVTLEIWAAGWA